MYKPFPKIPNFFFKKSHKYNNPSTMKHIRYLFNNETIFLGFSILNKNWTWKPKSDQREKESEVYCEIVFFNGVYDLKPGFQNRRRRVEANDA